MSFPDPPTNQADLLAGIQAHHQALDALLAGYTDAQMERHILQDAWSLKDVLAHITFWEQRLLLILRNAAQGNHTPNIVQPDDLPPDAFRAALDRLNAEVYRANAHRPLAEVRADYARAFAEVLATLAATPEADIFAPTGYQRIFGESPLGVIAGNTYGHYLEHSEYLRLPPASELTLRPIDATNWALCARLKVHPSRVEFVANNSYSLAQAAYTPHLEPLGMYAGTRMVGFTMHATEAYTDGRFWIMRVMVDELYQGHGYGRAAMTQLIARMRTLPECRVLALDYHPDNAVAAKLYAGLGFRPTGEVEGTEIIATLALSG